MNPERASDDGIGIFAALLLPFRAVQAAEFSLLECARWPELRALRSGAESGRHRFRARSANQSAARR